MAKECTTQHNGHVMAMIQEQLSALRFSTMILGKSSTFYLDAFTEAEIDRVRTPTDISCRVNLCTKRRSPTPAKSFNEKSQQKLPNEFNSLSLMAGSWYFFWRFFLAEILFFVSLTAFLARSLPVDETEKEYSATDKVYPPHVFAPWT